MFKRIIVISGILIAIIGGIYTYQVITKPDRIHKGIELTFADLGFQEFKLPEPNSIGRKLIYENIILDKDEFSTVDMLSVSHSPFIVSFSDDDTSATIKGLSLTGELAQNGQITIAGFKPRETSAINFKTIPKSITVEDFNISLLSQHFGGININGSIQIANEGDTLKLQGKLDAIQKQVAINAKLEGQYNQNGFIDLRIEIENGKFDIGHIQGTRIAGLILASGESFSALRSVSEIQTGALRIYDLPWQSAAITIDTKTDKPGAIISAKSAGYEGLELALTIPDLFKPEEFIGQLHADALQTAIEYLNSQGALAIDETSLKNISNLENLSVKFAKRDGITFRLEDESSQITITGLAQADENGLSGEIKSAPIPLVNISDKLAGVLTIKGTFKQQDKLQGDLAVKLDRAVMPYGLVSLSKINATLHINKLDTLSGANVKDINCAVKDFKLDEHCTVTAGVKNGVLTLSDLLIDGTGFSLFVPQADKDKTLLQIQSVNVREILQLFGNPKWKGQGIMDGNAIVETKHGKPTITNFSLTNKDNGVLQLTDPKLFEMMEMEDLEKETMKLALENFYYDLLEIKASGEFPDKVKISVFGKGKNPLLMQGRPFSIDFEITPDFTKISKEISKEN